MTENNNLVVSYFTKKSQLFTIESSTISVSSTIVDSLNSPKRSQINNEGNYLVISSSS